MTAIGVYDLSKRFRIHDQRSRWLRRDVVQYLLGESSDDDWRTILHNINIEVRRGETVALLGRNGSGKSTLLKLMAGILRPTTGRVTRQGSLCAMMDICTGFQEDLTGRENTFINGAILGLSASALDALMPEIEYFAELECFMDTPVRYYSSGMKARLSFAVAMTADPDIFLIDEVLAVGDEGFRNKCYARLDQLISKGRTIVMVSHDTGSVKRLCERAIWLDSGTVRMDGPSEEVCECYVDNYYQPIPVE